ncbi:MAG: FtsX-like permease family protein [Bacteroidales bacterium]|nr:FtsX-like permease family protein [Bacteroidales bacterium]
MKAVGNVNLNGIEKDFRLSGIHPYWFMIDKDLFARKKTGGNKLMCYILLSIALLFLAIATFNYINFAMASIPFRIRDINTRKVFGASRRILVMRQLLAAAGIVGAAFVFGVLVMRTLDGTSWITFLSGSLSPRKNIPVICLGGAAALAITLISGLIPAFYSTSFQPALILKGTLFMTVRGGGLRTVTLVLQFVLSFIFIITGLTLRHQTSYMVNNNKLGFDHDLVLVMKSHLFSSMSEVADRVRDIPGVVEVARGESPIQEHTSSASELRVNDEVIRYSYRCESPEYADFFKLSVVEGRLPLPGESHVALINESFHEAVPSYGVGQSISDYSGPNQIIGVLKDFHNRSLQYSYQPMVFFINDKCNASSLMIRVQPGADVKGILEKSRKIYSELRNIDEEDIETGFLDKDIEKLYEKEILQTSLIEHSSLLSLIIALIGILGLVWFDTRFMRKEVAIRKVNGASAKDILSMINKKYVIISAVGFVIAAPIALAICRRWMSQFAFRTNIPVWIFVVSFIAVMLITLTIVTLQSWRAANANPVNALKNE